MASTSSAVSSAAAAASFTAAAAAMPHQWQPPTKLQSFVLHSSLRRGTAAAPYMIATRGACIASVLPSHCRHCPPPPRRRLPNRHRRRHPSARRRCPCHAAPSPGWARIAPIDMVLSLLSRPRRHRFAPRRTRWHHVRHRRSPRVRAALRVAWDAVARTPHSSVHRQRQGDGGAAWLGGFLQAQACHAIIARTSHAGIWLRGRRGAGGDHRGAPLAQDLNSAFQDVSVRYVGRCCKLQLAPSRISCTFRVPKGSSGPALALATPP